MYLTIQKALCLPTTRASFALSDQLKIHCKWFNASKLSINANKTNYITFHKSRKNVYNNYLILNNSPLHCVANTKFLGVIVQENLSW